LIGLPQASFGDALGEEQLFLYIHLACDDSCQTLFMVFRLYLSSLLIVHVSNIYFESKTSRFRTLTIGYVISWIFCQFIFHSQWSCWDFICFSIVGNVIHVYPCLSVLIELLIFLRFRFTIALLFCSKDLNWSHIIQ
jgi:hypothetical protein